MSGRLDRGAAAPEDYALRPDRGRRAPLVAGRRQPVLEFVNEVVEPDVDVNAAHDAIAALLVRWWREARGPGAATE